MAATENRGPVLQGVAYALFAMAFVSAVLRCWCRLFIVRKFGGDDWLMLMAMISFTLFVTCALVGVHYGTGRHAADLTPENISQALKYWWLCYVWYCVTMICSKLSIGYFLLILVLDRTRRAIIYTALILTVLCGAVFFFVTVLQCRPVSHFWDRTQPGTCLDIRIIEAITYLYSALSIISDFTFSLLPIFLIWNLQMDTRTKIVLVPILSIGCVASIAVTVRLAYVHKFSDPDFLYATVDIAVWSTMEQGLSITAGSLATLRPLLRKTINAFSSHTETRDVSAPTDDIVTFGRLGRQKRSREMDDSIILMSVVGGQVQRDSTRKPTWSSEGPYGGSEEELHNRL